MMKMKKDNSKKVKGKVENKTHYLETLEQQLEEKTQMKKKGKCPEYPRKRNKE